VAGGVEDTAVFCLGVVDDGVECFEQFLPFHGLDKRVGRTVESVEGFAELLAQFGDRRSIALVVVCGECLEDSSSGCPVLVLRTSGIGLR
jgi:hypothetical protein